MLDNSLNIHSRSIQSGEPIRSSNPTKMQQITNNQTYSGNVAFTAGVSAFSTSAKLQNPQDKQMYNELSNSLDKDTRISLENLLKTGKLLANNSNDGSSTLQNLYKILKEPRVTGLNTNTILTETIKAIENPFIITQNFGQIPDFQVQSILNTEKFNTMTSTIGLNGNIAPHFNQARFTGPAAAITPEDLNVVSSGTCVAASIEFNLADKKPAEFARFVAGLTSPALGVKSLVRYQDIAPNMVESVDLLTKFGVAHKTIDWENIEVTLNPDRNAIVRARVQNTMPQQGTRTTVDTLMQSTFMQLGSANSYNTLIDKRYGGFNPNEKGLTEFEKNFTEAIIDNNGGKTSVTYQIVDENAVLKGYSLDFETTKKHLLDSLNSGANVIIGITEVDKANKIVGGHEITIVGTKQDKNGELSFICNDTDDDYVGAIEIKAKDLIPKIHHAGIPNKVLNLENQPESGYILLNEFQMLKQQKNINNQILVQPPVK